MKKIKEYKICIVLVLFQVILEGFVMYYINFLEGVQILMAICMFILGIVIDVWVFLALAKVREKEKIEQQLRTMREEQYYEQENLEKAHHYIASMKERKRDFYNTLQVLYGKCDEGRRVEEVKEAYNNTSISLNNMKIDKYCESPIVNAVIASKYEEMKSNGIRMKIAIDELSDDMGIERMDLCSVFSNLLDNAIEACMKLQEGRYINIRAKTQTGYLSVAVENSFSGKLQKNDIGYKSSKKDEAEHGYGTKILSMIAERYEGKFYLEEHIAMVKAIVLLKLEEK